MAEVVASPEALEAIERLRAQHGPVVFFQSGGCCGGSLPMCLASGDLQPAPDDLLLGEVGGAAFYIDRELHVRWGQPSFRIDLAAGSPEGFSLGPPGMHFVSRPLARGGDPVRAGDATLR
jgi:uncharacterized protein (DUF779 family)